MTPSQSRCQSLCVYLSRHNGPPLPSQMDCQPPCGPCISLANKEKPALCRFCVLSTTTAPIHVSIYILIQVRHVPGHCSCPRGRLSGGLHLSPSLLFSSFLIIKILLLIDHHETHESGCNKLTRHERADFHMANYWGACLKR